MTGLEYINKWESTGIYAVDMVASCISHERNFRRPVKSIRLQPNVFTKFESWVKREAEKMGEDWADGRHIIFDGVTIEKGSVLMIKSLLVEYYPVERND